MIEFQTAIAVKRRAWTFLHNRDLWAIGFILIVTLAFFYKLIFLGKTFWGADIEFFFYPTRAAWASALREGTVPSILWSPYIFGGYPLFAEGQTGALYPPNLLFGLPFLTPLVICNLQIVLHCFLAGVFMYAYTRVVKIERVGALISAFSFAFSGFMVSHLSHMSLMDAAVWLPLLFLFTELALAKGQWRFLLLAGLSLGIQISAGHPQVALMAVWALGGYIIFRTFLFTGAQKGGLYLPELSFLNRQSRWRKLRAPASELVRSVLVFSLVVAIGVSVAAAQLLPLFELTNTSARAGGAVNYATAASYSLPTENLKTLVFPFHFGGPVGNYWGKWNFSELALYVGVVPLVLALASLYLRPNRYTILFLLLGTMALLLALGDATPLFKVLHSLPIYRGLRAPARFVLLVDFALAVLAGMGATKLYNTNRSNEQRRTLFLALFLLLVVFMFFLYDVGFDKLARGLLPFKDPLPSVVVKNQPEYAGVQESFAFNSALPPGAVSTSWVEPDLSHRIFLPLVMRTTDTTRILELIVDTFGRLWGDYYRVSPYMFLLAAAVILFFSYGKKATVWIRPLLIALVVVDIFMFTQRVNAYLLFDHDQVPGETHERTAEFLRTAKDSRHVYSIRRHPSNSLLPLGISSLDGYGPLQLKQHQDYEIALISSGFDASLLSLGNVGYVVDHVGQFGQVAAREGFPLVYETGTVRVYENIAALPRAFVVHSATIETGNNPLELFRRGVLDPTKTVVLEKEFDISRLSGQGKATVVITDYTATQVTVRASLTSNGFLVLNDTYYPGWEAFVDGEKSEVYRANHLFRAVFLPAGDHTVEFLYRPVPLRLGVIVSLLTLSGITGVFIKIVLDARRSKKAR